MLPPPLSTSPSLASFESYRSDTVAGQNYEVDRLRLIVSASQEDLRLQQSHFDEEHEFLRRRYETRERQLQERFAAERSLLEARILDLERDKAGEGSRGSRRG